MTDFRALLANLRRPAPVDPRRPLWRWWITAATVI